MTSGQAITPDVVVDVDPTPTLDELITRLDPGRDYGPRTYNEIVAAVQQGEIIIKANGDSLPILHLAGDNFTPLKGSGARERTTTQLALSRALKKGDGREWFERKMAEPLDYDIDVDDPTTPVRDILFVRAIQEIKNESGKFTGKLIEFMLTQHIGKPKETINRATETIVETALAQLEDGEVKRTRVRTLKWGGVDTDPMLDSEDDDLT